MTEIADREGPIVVIGSAGYDLVGKPVSELRFGTSNPGQLRISAGGVARNIAENLARLGMDVSLVSVVGQDPQGEQILSQTAESGVDIDQCLIIPDRNSGTYLAILDHGGALHLGIDDMGIMEMITPEVIQEHRELIKSASVLVLDANLPERSFRAAVSIAWRSKVPIAADPTSVSLAPMLCPSLERLWLITPNEAEASVICPHPVPHADRDQAVDAARYLVSAGVKVAIITMAEFGVGYATPAGSGHIPAVKTEILDPTGAGDAMTATVIYALLEGIPTDEAIRLGASAAALTLRSRGSVAPDLSLERLYEELL